MRCSFVEIISYTLPCKFTPHVAYDRKAERKALVFMRITHPEHQIKQSNNLFQKIPTG